MTFTVGDSVGIISVWDTGLVALIHQNAVDHNVDRDSSRTIETFPSHDLFPLMDGKRVTKRHWRELPEGRKLLQKVTYYRRGPVRRVRVVTYRITSDGHNMGRYPRR